MKKKMKMERAQYLWSTTCTLEYATARSRMRVNYACSFKCNKTEFNGNLMLKTLSGSALAKVCGFNKQTGSFQQISPGSYGVVGGAYECEVCRLCDNCRISPFFILVQETKECIGFYLPCLLIPENIQSLNKLI